MDYGNKGLPRFKNRKESLTLEERREILRFGSQKKIGEVFGMSDATVACVLDPYCGAQPSVIERVRKQLNELRSTKW